MMSVIFLALGLVLVVEGLAIALAPSRMEEILKLLSQTPRETRRMIGLIAIALGAVLIWITKSVFTG